MCPRKKAFRKEDKAAAGKASQPNQCGENGFFFFFFHPYTLQLTYLDKHTCTLSPEESECTLKQNPWSSLEISVKDSFAGVEQTKDLAHKGFSKLEEK